MFENKDGKAFRREGCNILRKNVYSGRNKHIIRFGVKMARFFKGRWRFFVWNASKMLERRFQLFKRR